MPLCLLTTWGTENNYNTIIKAEMKNPWAIIAGNAVNISLTKNSPAKDTLAIYAKSVWQNNVRTVGRYLKDNHNHLYAERDIERLNLALRLLDIIEEDGCCERVGKPFNFVKSKDKEDLYELEDDPESYYTIPVYVNYKNGMRFCKIELSRYTDSKDGALWQSHLRVEKAWHIYHTLRLYFMRSWWDWFYIHIWVVNNLQG